MLESQPSPTPVPLPSPSIYAEEPDVDGYSESEESTVPKDVTMGGWSREGIRMVDPEEGFEADSPRDSLGAPPLSRTGFVFPRRMITSGMLTYNPTGRWTLLTDHTLAARFHIALRLHLPHPT